MGKRCSICKNTRMKTLTHSAVRCVLKRYRWRLPDNVDKRGVRKWHLGRYYGYGTSLSWIPLNKFGGIATKPFAKHDVIFPKKIDCALRLIMALKPAEAALRAETPPATDHFPDIGKEMGKHEELKSNMKNARAETPAPREPLQKHRYGYAEVDLVAQCSCGWKYDAPVGRSNGWDWWAIHFEASLASDCAETEEAIRKLSWDEPCNGKWTAVVRVEHVLAILRAAGELEQAK